VHNASLIVGVWEGIDVHIFVVDFPERLYLQTIIKIVNVLFALALLLGSYQVMSN